MEKIKKLDYEICKSKFMSERNCYDEKGNLKRELDIGQQKYLENFWFDEVVKKINEIIEILNKTK